MVLNDIIEQAAGRHSRASDHGGKSFIPGFLVECLLTKITNIKNLQKTHKFKLRYSLFFMLQT